MNSEINKPGAGTNRVHAMLQVLWPAFFAAVILVGMLFSMVDPLMVEIVQEQLNHSREAAYTLAFLLIWAVVSTACATTRLLSNNS